jgi:hypothetical protein
MKTVVLMMVVSGSGVAFAQPGATPAADPATAPPVAPVEAPPAAPPAMGPPATVAASAAEPGASSTDAEPAGGPGFVVIDPLDRGSRIGIGLSYINLDDSTFNTGDLTVLRLDAQGHVVDKRTGLGGYFQVPFAYGRGSANGMSDTITDVGNLEVGVLFAPRIDAPGFGLALHVGVTLPTGEKDDESAVGTLASATALSGLYNTLPRSTTIKLGISPMFRSGIVFGRLDLGFDGNVDADRTAIGNGIHFNAGLGVDLGGAAVMLESENLAILDLDDRKGSTFNAVAVSARATGGAVSPFAAVVIPVDDDVREVVDFSVTAGIDFRL